jgi:ribosomal protein S18 acetylase RimI-like enzyme
VFINSTGNSDSLRPPVLEIRQATEADRDAIWNIFHAVVAPGDTYAFDPRISREDALAYWFREDTHTYVAAQDRPASRPEGSRLHQSAGSPSSFHVDIRPIAPLVIEGAALRSRVRRHVVGTYILRANQPGSGSHVANAAFMVAPRVRGLGVGRKMGEHCLNEARERGFRAMQFNFVVSTNEAAIRLWKQLGFEIVGTLPGAFRHPQKGYVDVYVMVRSLL